MPELPEVETIARQLRPLLRGRRIRRLDILDRRIGRLKSALLIGRRIVDVYREAKYVVLKLDNQADPFAVAVHLRMTGRLIWVPLKGRGRNKQNLKKSLAKQRDPFFEAIKDYSKHVRVVLWCSGGALVFSDARRFGTWEFVNDFAEIAAAGIDPSRPAFTADAFAALFAKQKQPIKNFLLRQDKVTGLGNIYVSEALFRAGIHPERPAGTLTGVEQKVLHATIKKVITEAIKHCGTTFSDYQDSTGEEGGFGRFLRVYGRDGEPCRKCRQAISRSVQAGRSSFFCARCQK